MQVGLEQLLAEARRRIDALRSRSAELERRALAAPVPRAFEDAFRGNTVGVIAEVKRRSPSAGVIREDLDPAAHARAYVDGGAVAVSVLTEPSHFGGSLDDLVAVAGAVDVPVLRKDFIVDELQCLEARAAGASAILLIARALDPERLRTLTRTALGLGLGVLAEAHAEREVDEAAAAGATAVGVNSRDLDTFTVDLAVAERLLRRVPREMWAVAESGITARADVGWLAEAGADAVLVGTSVARQAEPAAAVRALAGVPRRDRGGV